MCSKIEKSRCYERLNRKIHNYCIYNYDSDVTSSMETCCLFMKQINHQETKESIDTYHLMYSFCILTYVLLKHGAEVEIHGVILN